MHSASINRFEWLKAVLQAEGLTPTAKTVASALAVKFFNEESGQMNPTQETLADFLKVLDPTSQISLNLIDENSAAVLPRITWR